MEFAALATVVPTEFLSIISKPLTATSSVALAVMMMVPEPVNEVGDADTNVAAGAALSNRVGSANVVAPLFPYMSSA
jgi:hypothetical protein